MVAILCEERLALTVIRPEALRTHANIGDKTVIVHHLSKLTLDVERKIRNGMLEATVMSLLVVVFLVVVLSMRQSSSTGSAATVVASAPASTAAGVSAPIPAGVAASPSPAPAPGLWESMKIVMDQIPAFFAVPVGMFIFIMKSVSTFIFLQEQVGKFSDVLE